MPLNGQFLDKSGLTYLWSKLKTKFAEKQDTIADLADIRSGAASGKSSYDFIFGLGTALQSYDDLNNYKNPGKVQAVNGAIARTISNTPWTQSGFTAITIPNLTLTSCMQFVLPNTMGGKWYRRRYMQDTWSPWTEYDGTQVTTT